MMAEIADGSATTGLPLRGRRIVITRPAGSTDDFASGLKDLGAEILLLPLTRIEAPMEPEALRLAARSAEAYDWIVFTSANAVARFGLARDEGGPRWPSGKVRICAVGPGTAAAVRREGGKVDLIPTDHRAEGVVGAIVASGPLEGRRVLFPRAEGARPVIADSLKWRGAEVVEVIAYRTVADPKAAPELRRRLDLGEIDVITFTSGSAVRAFAALVGTAIGGARVASIGPVTSAVTRELGLEVTIEAGAYSTEGLTAAIARYYAEGR